MQNSFLELRCKFLRLLKSCPPSLKIEPHYPAACSRLNDDCSWARLIIDNLEEAVSLFDLHNHVPSLRAAGLPPFRRAGVQPAWGYKGVWPAPQLHGGRTVVAPQLHG